MSQECRTAYKLRIMELERRQAFDDQWQAVKAEHQQLYLQFHQQLLQRRRASMAT